jgi:hypothetical protein
MSTRTRTALVVTTLVIVPLAFIAVGSFGDSSEDATTTTFRVRALEVAADAPKGWTQQRNDTKRLYLYTDQSFIDENCASDADYSTVLLTVGPLHGSTNLVPMKRPDHFNETQGTGIETDEDYADLGCNSTAQAIAFLDHGREFVAALTFGRDATPARRAEAYRILDSLDLTP